MALNLDIDLKDNLSSVTETFKYLLQTCAAVLEIDMAHILKFLIEFDPVKLEEYLPLNKLYDSIHNLFYNPFQPINVKLEDILKDPKKVNPHDFFNIQSKSSESNQQKIIETPLDSFQKELITPITSINPETYPQFVSLLPSMQRDLPSNLTLLP